MDNKNNINLDEISKDNPFKVPDGYFENFTVRMVDKISQAEAAKMPKPVFGLLRPQFIAILSVACVALIVFGSVFSFYKSHKHLSNNELTVAYESAALREMNDAELADFVANAEQPATDNPEITNDATRQSIIDYLIHENIDINTLIEAQ